MYVNAYIYKKIVKLKIHLNFDQKQKKKISNKNKSETCVIKKNKLFIYCFFSTFLSLSLSPSFYTKITMKF